MSGGAAAALQGADPLIKTGVALCLGILVWRAGPAGLVFYLAALALVAFLASGRAELRLVSIRIVCSILLIWVLAKAGFEAWAGSAWPEAAAEAGILGLRLLVLITAGLCLTAVTSSHQIGVAISRIMRPVAGRKSWQGALGLALMIHFLPLTLRLLRQVRLRLQLRSVPGGFPFKLRLWVQTVLRELHRKTYVQTLALTARGLDDPQKWTPRSPVPLNHLVWGAGICLALVAVSWL